MANGNAADKRLINKRKPARLEAGRVEQSGGELGIRTPDSLRGNTRLAGEHLRPLGQLSKFGALESYLTNAHGHKG